MCFSATASFAAAGVLTATGVVAYKKAGKDAALCLYAGIPLLFAIQQAIEGWQWLVDRPSTISTILGYGFLFFAYLVWPSYIPYTVFRLEKDPRRKHLSHDLMIVGFMATVYGLVVLGYEPLLVSILGHSINYQIYAAYSEVAIALYVAIICGALLLSTRKRVNVFGCVLLLSYGLSTWIFNATFTSVWCYFSALLSAVVLWEVWSVRKK
jgi:hypothetical protein